MDFCIPVPVYENKNCLHLKSNSFHSASQTYTYAFQTQLIYLLPATSYRVFCRSKSSVRNSVHSWKTEVKLKDYNFFLFKYLYRSIYYICTSVHIYMHICIYKCVSVYIYTSYIVMFFISRLSILEDKFY